MQQKLPKNGASAHLLERFLQYRYQIYLLPESNPFKSAFNLEISCHQKILRERVFQVYLLDILFGQVSTFKRVHDLCLWGLAGLIIKSFY